MFSDVDLSAYKAGVVRPAYEKMQAAARAGEFDAVVIWKVDRLARSLREFLRVVEMFDQYGIALLSVNESFDTSSPMGRAMMQIIGVFAELESATISLRTKNAKAHDAARGHANGGGRRPFGYTKGTFAEVVPEEAELLREAAGRLLAGQSLRSIAADWNARGLTTTKGSTWNSSNLGRMLRGDHVAGRRRHGAQVVDGVWPLIFSAEEHEAIRLAAGDHRRAKVARHLLTGFARCSLCGGNMGCKTTKRFGFQYACQAAGCGRLIIKGSTLEEVISEAVLLRLDARRRASSPATKARDGCPRELRSVKDGRPAPWSSGERSSRPSWTGSPSPRRLFGADPPSTPSGSTSPGGSSPRSGWRGAGCRARPRPTCRPRPPAPRRTLWVHW